MRGRAEPQREGEDDRGLCARRRCTFCSAKSLPLPPICTTYLPDLSTSRTTVLTLVSTTTFAKLSLSPPLTCSSQMTELSIMGTTSSIHDTTLPHLPHYLTIAAYLIHTACTQAATVSAESSSCFCRERDVKCLHSHGSESLALYSTTL